MGWLSKLWDAITYVPEKVVDGTKAVGGATKDVAVGAKDKVVDVAGDAKDAIVDVFD